MRNVQHTDSAALAYTMTLSKLTFCVIPLVVAASIFFFFHPLETYFVVLPALGCILMSSIFHAKCFLRSLEDIRFYYPVGLLHFYGSVARAPHHKSKTKKTKIKSFFYFGVVVGLSGYVLKTAQLSYHSFAIAAKKSPS